MTSRFIGPLLGGPGSHVWGCHIRGCHFLYVYGTQAEYRTFRERERPFPGDLMDKGLGSTMWEVQQHAEQAARNLGDMYDGIGSVRVVKLLDHLAAFGPGQR